MSKMSNAESVKEFTEGMTGNTCPNKPIPLTKDDALFIVRMVMSELDELICTVSTTEDERDKLMQQSLDTRDKCKNFSYNNELELISNFSLNYGLAVQWRCIEKQF